MYCRYFNVIYKFKSIVQPPTLEGKDCYVLQRCTEYDSNRSQSASAELTIKEKSELLFYRVTHYAKRFTMFKKLSSVIILYPSFFFPWLSAISDIIVP